MSLRQGNLEQAIEQWNRYRTLSTLEAEDEVLSVAQRVARSAKAEVAMPFYQVVVDQYKTLWQSYYGYGVLAAHYGQNRTAEQALNSALERLNKTETDKQIKQKATQQIYQLLSKVYLQSDNYDTGLKVLTEYLKKQPEDWLLQERLARLEVKANRFKSAESRYQRILQANPDANTSRLSLALLQIELEKFADAEQNLQQVSQNKAYVSVGNYYLGVLSQEQSRVEQAIGYFEKVKADPYRVDAQLHIAEILFPIRGLEATLEVLDRVETEDKKEQVKLLRARAIFYRASEQYDQAVTVYEQALTLAPDNTEILLAQAVLFYDQQQFTGYERNIKRVLALQPDSVDALNALGYFYAERGINLDRAQQLLDRALALDPDSYYVLDSVGWLAYQFKDYVKAEAYLRKALSIKLDEEVLMHLVATIWKAGRTDEAYALWQKYQSRFLKNKRYQKLIENLQSGVPIK